MTIKRTTGDPWPARSDQIDLLLDLSARLRSGTTGDLEDALALASNFFGEEFGIVSRVEGDAYFVEHVCCPPEAELEAGQRFELGNTYCSITLQAEDVVSIDEMASSTHNGHPCYKKFGLESYIGAPLRVEGEVYGTLNFSSPRPRPEPWSQTDRRLIRLLARWVESSILQQRLTDRLDRALVSLEHANLELDEKNKDLNAFVFAASHDLKEPLRSIGVLAGFLRDDLGKVAPSVDENLALVETTSHRGLCLVADLLDYASISRHTNRIELVNLNAVVERVVEDMKDLVDETEGTVTFSELPEIWTDRLQVRQLLQNLLGNALKYHSPGVPPEVLVEAFPATGLGDGTIELRVQDNGIGFDEEDVERIFLPFERLHDRNLFDGSGIGLAICARIVERLGGAITAQSEKGFGSTFIVRLPQAVSGEGSPHSDRAA